jgi:hypothetical protein
MSYELTKFAQIFLLGHEKRFDKNLGDFLFGRACSLQSVGAASK